MFGAMLGIIGALVVYRSGAAEAREAASMPAE
jgi:hypothetical protein